MIQKPCLIMNKNDSCVLERLKSKAVPALDLRRTGFQTQKKKEGRNTGKKWGKSEIEHETVRQTKKCTNEHRRLRIEVATVVEATRVAWKDEKWKSGKKEKNFTSCSWFLGEGVEWHFYEEKTRKPGRWTAPTSRHHTHAHTHGSLNVWKWRTE